MSLSSFNPDTFAVMLQFANLTDCFTLRLVSKKTQRIVDNDQIWSSNASTAASHVVPLKRFGSWKKFFFHCGLHRLRAQPAHPVIGTWAPLVNLSVPDEAAANPAAGVNSSLLSVNQSVFKYVDAISPSRAFGSTHAAPTMSIGFILTQPTSTPSTAKLVQSLHAQLLQFAGFAAKAGTDPASVQSLLDADTPAAIDVFTAFPEAGPDRHRLLATCLHLGDGYTDHLQAIAHMVEILFSTCSVVVFLGDTTSTVQTFVNAVGSHMTHGDRAPFSTAQNTPSVVFAGMSQTINVAKIVTESPQPIASWITQRSSSVGESLLEHGTLLSLHKGFHVPSFLNPAVRTNMIPVSTILRMVEAAVLHPAAAGGIAGAAWSGSVMTHLCSAQQQVQHQFYIDALQTDYQEMTKPVLALDGIGLQVPADPSPLVALHNQHFYAALRNYCMALPPVCGSNSTAGLVVLEQLKRNISDSFRDVWVHNREVSREYCTVAFEKVFEPVMTKFLVGDDPEGFNHRKGLKQFYASMQDKMLEYKLKSKGHRRFDILSEKISSTIVPLLMSYVDEHPNHPHICRADAESISQELVSDCHKHMSDFARTIDGEFGQLQRMTALYTASVGNEWAASLQVDASAYLRSQEEDADAWHMTCAMRSGFLLSANRQHHVRSANSDSDDEATHSVNTATETSSQQQQDTTNPSSPQRRNNSVNDLDELDEALMQAQREVVLDAAREAEGTLRAAALRLASNLTTHEAASFAVIRTVPKRKGTFMENIRQKIANW